VAAEGGRVTSRPHVRHRNPLARLASLALVAAAAAGLAWTGTAHAARAATVCRYGLGVAALVDANGTQVALTVSTKTPSCKPPGRLRTVKIRIARAGRVRGVRLLKRVRAPQGRVAVKLKGLARHDRLRVVVRFGTRALSARAVVLRRPDLVVLAAPATSVAAATPSALQVTVAERNGDVGTTARVVAVQGAAALAATTLRVPAGRRVPVRLTVTIPAAGQYAVAVSVTDTTGRETATPNDTTQLTVEAGDFALDPTQVLVPSLGGYGAQLNQNVYAAISRQIGVTDENLPDMEAKTIALHPGLVRIFFNGNAYNDADLMQSFVRTVQLAQRAGSTINITWAGGGESTPDTTMARFAGVLVDLVKNRGITRLRWVTVENEPNSSRITMQQYDALYRALDRDLAAAGVRKQIRFMGGDLVQAKSPLGETQAQWFTFLATNMADLLDAWSIHVYWDYWDTEKLVRRLTQVRQIVDALPADQRRPLYVTEFSARGLRALNGATFPEPGVYADGTPLPATTINAFQHAWFDVLAARLGYAGTIKWDGYAAKYDRGTQDYSLIGPPTQGWPLRPVYHVTRLFTSTTRPGWKVVGIAGSSGTKLVAAYAAGKQTTAIGLDTSGATLATPSTTVVSYAIGGLPRGTSFQLYVWNPDGSGAIAAPTVVQSDAAGMVQVTAPLQSVFAVTTLA
jgi:hypothetical protein